MPPTPLSDALHPAEGVNPAQPPEPLGGVAVEPTEGHPPFVNLRLSLAEWRDYIAGYAFNWKVPSRVVLHHTWRPTGETWTGLGTMRRMQYYYAGLGWTSAPHLYVAPDGIWLATPMSRIGIHAGRGNGSVKDGWYSIGLEMVGDFDQERPAGAVWAQTLAVLQGLQQRIGRPLASILSFHRDYSTKSCPGNRVTRAWVLEQFAGLNPPSVALSAESAIIGRPLAPDAAVIAAFARLCARRGSPYSRETPNPITATIGPAYAEWCNKTGVRLVLVLAQCAHETGWLTSALSQRRDKEGRHLRNPAGIGVYEARDRATPHYRPGTVWDADVQGYRPASQFTDWRFESVPAHIGRLVAYATKPNERTVEQQAAVIAALMFRDLPLKCQGSARTLRELGSGPNPAPGCGWAGAGEQGGLDYGMQVAEKANAIMAEVSRE